MKKNIAILLWVIIIFWLLTKGYLNSATPLISIIGIIIPAVVAVNAIKKTSEFQSVNNLRTELRDCIVQTAIMYYKIGDLLNDIALQRTIYNRDKRIETAYVRYFRELSNLTKEAEDLLVKQFLLFPKDLRSLSQSLTDELNKANQLVPQVTPDENDVYKNTDALKEIVKKSSKKYQEFINMSRNYIGSDILPTFDNKEGSLFGKEIQFEKKENKSQTKPE